MKRYFIHTFGCQMNVNDTNRMGEVLTGLGYRATPVADEADLIILNTCSIREKAEEKLYSALGRYRQLKLQRGALLGVGGCVAQQEKEKVLKKVRYVDFVFGPDNIAKLPEILRQVALERARVVETAWVESEEYVFPRADPESSRGRVTEFVTVMKGCDNVCAFCVVPHTRGREVSRPCAEVLAEVASLTKVGVREVTLIGQNVNSYRGGVGFAQLLLRVAEVPGIERVRFTTSHPHDLSDELIDAFAVQPKLAPHFHLPLQSASDAVLARMRRDYTLEGYLARLGKLRAARPEIAVTTDIIVGFPGETDEDFEATMRLTEAVRFDNQFSFVYSARPKTVAAARGAQWGEVPHEVKVARLDRLQKVQKRIAGEINALHRGGAVEVLVEGRSKNDPRRRFGRTPQNKVVNFDGDAPIGAIVEVQVGESSVGALYGSQGRTLLAPSILIADPPLPSELCVA